MQSRIESLQALLTLDFELWTWTWIVTILNWNIHILSMSLISAVRIWSRDYGNAHHLKCSKWKNWRHPTNSYHPTNNFCQLGNYENKNVSSFYLSKFFVIVTYWLCTLYRIRSTQMIFFTIVFLTLFVQFVEQITKITDLWRQLQKKMIFFFWCCCLQSCSSFHG